MTEEGGWTEDGERSICTNEGDWMESVSDTDDRVCEMCKENNNLQGVFEQVDCSYASLVISVGCGPQIEILLWFTK